jgi:hypothetical protein
MARAQSQSKPNPSARENREKKKVRGHFFCRSSELQMIGALDSQERRKCSHRADATITQRCSSRITTPLMHHSTRLGRGDRRDRDRLREFV